MKPKVLIVEDNLLISMEVQFLLEECGCEPVGPAASCADALMLVENRQITAAVLDVNLGEERVWPILDVLHERRVPFILVTGYSRTDIPERYRNGPILSKPLGPGALRNCLQEIGVTQGGAVYSSKPA